MSWSPRVSRLSADGRPPSAPTTSAAAWALGYGYNANGHLASQTYPSGLAVSYAPNALGQPTQAGSYATGVSWFPNGALKAFTYGNGVVHTATQNARGLPLRTTDCAATGTCSAANRRLDLQYAYDANGNVSQITDYVTGGKQTRGMSYDALDRLVQTTSNMFGTASYGYDVLENLNTVHVSGGSQARNHTYAYDPATRRLSQVTNTVGGAVVANLAYDVQGNLASKGSQAYQFDLGNRLRSVPGQETGYEYDGHGRRVFAQTVGSGQVLSQYGNDGKLLYQNDARHGRRTDYVYLGNRLVAYRERPLSSSTATVKYQHVDALGTPIAVTNAAKATIETGEYEPYGRLVNKPLFDGPGYTGHVQDAATGLTYMQQRYYDPMIGLFLSVDPVTAYSGPVAMFNRYRYANSNPYRFYDPDGRCTGSRITNSDGTCRSTGEFTTIATTASGRGSGGARASVPDNIKIEAKGYDSAASAAVAAGQRYGSEGVETRREVQLGITKVGDNNWGYLTPGWGPQGATRVDPTDLLNAYINAGFIVKAWMHGHFDSQLNFSAIDFALVWKTEYSTYLVNSKGQVRMLNDGHLQSAMRFLPRSSRRLQLQGLQSYYSETGLPGDEL